MRNAFSRSSAQRTRWKDKEEQNVKLTDKQMKTEEHEYIRHQPAEPTRCPYNIHNVPK